MVDNRTNSPEVKLKQKIEDLFSSKFDPIHHLKQLDFPKRSGTAGDKKAADYIASTLKRFGYEPISQEFHYLKSNRISSLRFPLIVLIWGLLSLLNILYFTNNKMLGLITLSLPLVIIIVLFRFEAVVKFFFRRRAKKLEELESKIRNNKLTESEKTSLITSQNVVTDIGNPNATHQILFTAHFDSISSILPMKFSKIIGILGFISFFLFSILYTINFISIFYFEWDFMEFLTPVFVILLITALILLELLLISRSFRGNESHGIIDDGSGVAILLELAKFLKMQNMTDYRFTFGFFSAEEAGLIGSSYYHRNSQLDKNTHVISVDMIGENPPLKFIKGINPLIKTSMNPEFNTCIASIAKELDIELKGASFFYPGSDFAHWLYDGHPTNWLINGSKLIHSRHDNLANLNKPLVIDALKILIAYFTLSMAP